MSDTYAGEGGNVNLVRTYAPSKFSHASAIAPLRGGTILAFYSGLAECHDSQRVWLFFNDKDGKTHDPIYIEGLTGNPALLAWDYGVKLIYSKFEKLVPRRVEWWQHCSLWVRDLDFQDGELKISAPQPLQTDLPLDKEEDLFPLGYLPRCNPITADGFLLPLYRERKPDQFYGVILHSYDGVQWTLRGKIGENETSCIQPTIWYQNNEVHALLRNFTRGGIRRAKYSLSKDLGHTWSEPVDDARFYNANNSILAIDCPNKDLRRKEILLVWNDDPTGRNNLVLGSHNGVITQLDTYGSYPAACVAGDRLHITWTAKANKLKFPYAKSVIKHVEYDLNSVVRYTSQNWGLGTTPQRKEVDEYQT